MGIPWSEVVPDGIGGVGVIIAAVGTVLATMASRRSITVSERLELLEADRRHTELTPEFTSTLDYAGDDDFRLTIWLDSAEALGKLRVVVREARNMSGPVGFKRGQDGVGNELPPAPELEGILPAWLSDTLHPMAETVDRLAPGNGVGWDMQLRRNAMYSGGAEAVRLKVLAWPEDPAGIPWELPLPVTISDRARGVLDQAVG